MAVFDGTKIAARIPYENCFVLEAEGIQETIIEVGELFAWMAGALRSAPGDRIAYVTPYLATKSDSDFRQSNEDIMCEIKFVLQKSAAQSPSNSKCWQNLFRNPVVVLGFPVRRRSQQEAGLEISLATLAALLGARRIAVFDGKVFLKGFSTMLVPTKRVGDMVIWHVLFNENGDRISYSDSRVREIAGGFERNLKPSELETSRHIVGWCTNVIHRTGEHQQDK